MEIGVRIGTDLGRTDPPLPPEGRTSDEDDVMVAWGNSIGSWDCETMSIFILLIAASPTHCPLLQSIIMGVHVSFTYSYHLSEPLDFRIVKYLEWRLNRRLIPIEGIANPEVSRAKLQCHLVQTGRCKSGVSYLTAVIRKSKPESVLYSVWSKSICKILSLNRSTNYPDRRK